MSAESYVPLSGFSTADAGRPSINYERGTLTIQFVDWQERLITIQFVETVAFQWCEEPELPAAIRADTSYEVIHSAWLAQQAARRASDADSRHYKLCFNAVGVLDIISGPFALMT